MEQIAGNGVQSPKNMTPENSSAVEPPAAGMGEFSRISGVFFDPKTAFADIAKRPTWIVPVVLVVVFGPPLRNEAKSIVVI